MLKWFRKYNKFILAVGCVVLMVAFLIPQAVQMFSPTGQNFVVGTINGEDVTEGDLVRAAFQLDLLRGMGVPDSVIGDSRERWLMQVNEARRLGLDASGGEVAAMLTAVGLDDEALNRRARESKVPAEFFRQTVREYLAAERYRMLTMGRRYDTAVASTDSPGLTTLTLWATDFLPEIQRNSREGGDPQFARRLQGIFSALSVGNGRMSPPASSYLARNALERVGGRLLVIEPEPENEAAVDEARLERLFEEYREFFPGRGRPYPLGYRQPEQVRVEFLRFPQQQALDAVTVESLDVFAYYRENKDQFAGSAEEAPDTPTDEAREQIEQRLQLAKAGELLRRGVAEARAMLDEDIRALETDDGYRVFPDAFEPVSLEQVAQRVNERTGLTPEVGNTGGWSSIDSFSQTEAGAARLPGSGASLAFYLALARELHPADTPLPAYVQVGVAGETGVSVNGDVFIPRLTCATPPRVPESLDEVREQVVADARRVNAYERLVAQAGDLADRAASEGLDALARDFEAEVNPIEPLPRRDPVAAAQTGRLVAPVVPGVGSSEAFIDAVFGVVADLPPEALLSEALTARERLIAEPIDSRLAVAVFEADRYDAPTRIAYEAFQRQNSVVAADFALLGDPGLLMRVIGEGSLAQRVGFELPDDRDDGDDTAAVDEQEAETAEADGAESPADS